MEPTKKKLSDCIPVGVSSCLLGEKVRYNGADKYDEFIVESLGPFFQWVPVCPEFEAGFGVPRESMHLIEKKGKHRLIGIKHKNDFTQQMQEFSRRRILQLSKLGLRGFLLKKNSPSCGMDKVKVYRSTGIPFPDGRGLFATALMEAFPNLPVEEEGRLANPKLRENWISRVFAYHDLRSLLDSQWTLGDLVKFHTRYKMVLLSHCPTAYQRLGRTVANAKTRGKKELTAEYEHEFMSALKKTATPQKHSNVLQHMLGHLKKSLNAEEKRDILNAINDYRSGLYPLSVPVVLLGHFIRKHRISYLEDQAYLAPHPKELALRNFT